MLSPDQPQKVFSHLFRSVEGQALLETYAILDAARDDSIYQKVAPLDTEDLCLYRGDKAIELATVAPYLLNLKRDDSFTEWLVMNGWGKSWGIFLQSSAPFKELRRHFRKFLMVYDEKGTPLYFRYYDPRVLRVYLPTCNADELKTVFGPIEYYLLEDENPNTILKFRNASGILQQDKMSL